MKYFKSPSNEVFGYDEAYPNDAPYIEAAIANGWEDITDSWPTVVTPTPEETAAQIRNRRDALLAKTDWIVVKSLEQGQEVPAEWKEYRQALRDITLQPNFPVQVTFPEPPSVN